MSRAPMLLLLVSAAGVLSVSARQTPTFRADTHTVPIYATVLDSAGRLVPNLARDDFDVLDEGKAQPLTLFANDVQPITIVIMLDRSGSMVGNFELVRNAAQQFVNNLTDQDKARLGSFSIGIEIDPAGFTSDRDQLIQILHQNLQAAGPTPLWDATSAAMDALNAEAGRRVVLVFTDGYDNPDVTDPRISFETVRDRSDVEGIMVYAIGFSDACGATSLGGASASPLLQRGHGFPSPPLGPSGPGRPGPTGGPWPGSPNPVPAPVNPPASPFGSRGTGSSDRGCAGPGPDPQLAALAASGGGGYFELHGTDNLGTTFARVADELHHQYLLGFTPAALDGRLHTLQVRLRNQPAMTVRARTSYFAASHK